MKNFWKSTIVIILLLLFLALLNSFLIIKSTQTSEGYKGIRLLGNSINIKDESKTIIDEPREVPIGNIEYDIQKDNNKKSDEKPPAPEPPPVEEIIPIPVSTQNIKIANWNLKIFGNTKASKPDLLISYAEIIDDYDIIFIQEIRNKDQTAFPKTLCITS